MQGKLNEPAQSKRKRGKGGEKTDRSKTKLDKTK